MKFNILKQILRIFSMPVRLMSSLTTVKGIAHQQYNSSPDLGGACCQYRWYLYCVPLSQQLLVTCVLLQRVHTYVRELFCDSSKR